MANERNDKGVKEYKILTVRNDRFYFVSYMCRIKHWMG